MAYEPLHHKYRPQTFGALVGQDAIATTLTSALNQRRIAPAYLFCGPRGTGKTSSARILAKSLNCIAQDHPTPNPCGTCETCRSITNGSALDFIEIDAASNTGVDNIRELIERAQFAPVQCRYKVYVIDECLTGDSLVLTQDGLVRIDDPAIEGKQVLSYDDQIGVWEFKRVLRWLDQGTRDILEIQTTHRRIRCTGNHLIRTDQGWVAARDIKSGSKILSPAPVAAAPSSTELALIDDSGVSYEGTSLGATPKAKNLTALSLSLSKLNSCGQGANAAVAKSWVSQNSCSKKGKDSKAFKVIGKNTLTERGMGFGISEPSTLTNSSNHFLPKPLGLSTALCWGIDPSFLPTNTADFPAWPGPMENSNGHGWNTKHPAFLTCSQAYTAQPMPATVQPLSVVEPFATLNLSRPSTSSEATVDGKSFPATGYPRFLQKDLPGGTWMMAPSASVPKAAPKSSSIPKAIPPQKISSLLNGSPTWVTQRKSDPTQKPSAASDTTTSQRGQRRLGAGWSICKSFPFLKWTTNLETVVSVCPAGVEPVYDIEVEDNHNFVANGLLVHNCHMLSTAAFNALLKTLEEPPSNVVFILATTDPQRVLPTIISRCQRFDYRRIPLEPMIAHLRKIADQENIVINDEALRLVAQVSQGGLRDAQSLLDQLSLLAPPVEADAVWDLVGAVPERDLLALVQAILSDDGTAVLDVARKLMDRGREPLIVLQNLAGFYRDLLIAKTAGGRHDLVAITPPTWADMQTLVQPLDPTLLLLGQQHLRSAEGQVKNTTQPRLWLEVTLLGLLPSTLAGQVGGTISAGRSSGAIGGAIAPIPTPQPAPPIVSPPASVPPPASPDPALPPETANGTAPAPAPVPAAASNSPPNNGQDAPPTSNATPSPNLGQLWLQVIAVLEPLGTRALMQQQGSLLFFDGVVARVGISSRPLFKMAQGRVENVEAAFQQVLNHKVQVSLEVLPDPKPEAPAPNISQAPGQQNTTPPTPVVFSPPPPPVVAAPPADASAEPVATPEPALAADASSAAPAPPSLPAIASDFDRAVKNFAHFFNGQVVDLDDDLSPGIDKTLLKPSEAAAKQPSHADKDVPF
ncbi:DNA polymerase III subunit gamma/tau [Phormidium tenue]|uniref:DNA-directed DNA polymerase n=1 Tax=Phormidium tenue NIES-30 TaxID=549789 RepID=A0A1U7J9V6_9CYAN|nr:DNA polymerase III, subunit gamma and tau [Phormidium tenue NIES-30]